MLYERMKQINEVTTAGKSAHICKKEILQNNHELFFFIQRNILFYFIESLWQVFW